MAKTFDQDVLLIEMPVVAQCLAITAQIGMSNHEAAAIVWGPPGIGKTATVRAIGRLLGVHTETVISSIRAPEDFSGMPVAVDGRMQYLPSQFVHNLMERGGGICFLDEASTAPPSVQAALLRVVQEKVVGDYHMENVAFIAAANPAHQAAGGWDLSAPLANRFCHIRARLNPTAWAQGVIMGFDHEMKLPILPKDWQRGIKKYRDLVAGFIMSHPTLLEVVPEDAASAGYAWASPRQWYDGVPVYMAACEAAGASADVLTALVSGSVGDKTGVEFMTWHKALDLPNPADLISGKVQMKWEKTRPDRNFTTLNAVSSYMVDILGTPTIKVEEKIKQWQAAWSIFNYGVEQGGPETVAAAARQLAIAGREHNPPMPLPLKTVTGLMPILRNAGLMVAN